MQVYRYSYTNVTFCDYCGRIEFNPYFFEFSALLGVRSRRKFCAKCASYLIDKLQMKVEVKRYE